ncbi:MAG: hypothetical protein GX308_03420 [Epulopiscium sp.]|nr:hypothetical protein [Candidatus Epulonipiscium sp.]
MASSYAHQFYEHSFLSIYQSNIEKKLQQIDLFLKTSPEKLNIITTSQLLNISEKEVISIMSNNNIDKITPASFFMIMVQGGSYICGLLKRQLQRGTKTVYTKEDISYIYQLNPEKIEFALEKSNIKQITSENIKTLFEYIPIQIWQ